MVRWMEGRILRRLAKDNRSQYGWLDSFAKVSPGIFWKLIGFSPLATHRKKASKSLVHMARIGAMQVYDCGACLQIAIDYAAKDGVTEPVRAALFGGNALPEPERLAFTFGRAVAANAPNLHDLIEEVRGTLGDGALADLSLTAGTAAVFPITKRGLGVANACNLEALKI